MRHWWGCNRRYFVAFRTSEAKNRITSFPRAIHYIMHERIHPGRKYVRVLPQVKIRIEKRTGISPFGGAMFEIMARDVDRPAAKIRISLLIYTKPGPPGLFNALY